MGKPDTKTSTQSRQLPITRLRGIASHVALLIASGILTAIAMPFTPELWLGWAASLLVAVALLSVRRHQPGIDDREVDWILAVLALVCGIWVLRQWSGSGNATADTAAWLLCATACFLIVSGTRAMSWVWPAALPALLWLAPPPIGALLVAAWVMLLLGVSISLMIRRGPAPPEQLVHMPLARLIQVLITLTIVMVAARWGVAP